MVDRFDEVVLRSIVDDYVAGATSLQLARRHRVAKATILSLLHARGACACGEVGRARAAVSGVVAVVVLAALS